MQLLAKVVEVLKEHEIDFVVIGASAMAVHGVSRSTLDIDLLTIDQRALRKGIWASLIGEKAEVIVRFGDVQDPLRDVVQIESAAQRPIDLVVGHGGWQTEIFPRAVRGVVGGVKVPIAEKMDLILLKLYAGGQQDLWDIQQLLGTDHSEGLQDRVETALEDLPAGMRKSWLRIVGG
ncbi:MAG: hypothetical protein GY906_20945 [bacterium]|nr:hypothetical protein [bacterium]